MIAAQFKLEIIVQTVGQLLFQEDRFWDHFYILVQRQVSIIKRKYENLEVLFWAPLTFLPSR
jgi:hypothetical protein